MDSFPADVKVCAFIRDHKEGKVENMESGKHGKWKTLEEETITDLENRAFQ